MNEQINEKMEKNFKYYKNQLKFDSLRLQELETKIRPMDDIERNLNMIDSEMSSIRIWDRDFQDMKRFIQTELPLFVHF